MMRKLLCLMLVAGFSFAMNPSANAGEICLVDHHVNAFEPFPPAKQGGSSLDRATKLSGIRSAIRDAVKPLRPRSSERKLMEGVLNDPDKMQLVYAHVEWLESQQDIAEVRAAESEKGPVLTFLDWIVDNWDAIKEIIQFVADLFASPDEVTIMPLGHREALVVCQMPAWCETRRVCFYLAA